MDALSTFVKRKMKNTALGAQTSVRMLLSVLFFLLEMLCADEGGSDLCDCNDAQVPHVHRHGHFIVDGSPSAVHQNTSAW